MVWSFAFFWKGPRAEATTTDITTRHPTSRRRRRINYHLLSQTKERQEYLLRMYVRTNQVGRIQDYYTSIQNYYYHRQQVLERTQQHRLDPPRRRQRRRRRKKRKNSDDIQCSSNNNDNNNNNNNNDDDDDSIHIMIDFGGGAGDYNHYHENANDDDDDFSSICVQQEGTETTRNPILPVLDRPPNRHDPHPVARRAVAGPHLHPGPSSAPLSSTATQQQLQLQPVYTMLDVDASIHAHYSSSSTGSSNGLMWWTILYYACFHHRYEIAVYLIEECYASLKCTDRYHNTILHWVCHSPQTTVSDDKGDQRISSSSSSSSSTLSLLQYIMECAPSLLLQRNDDGELPLHWLCRYGHLSLVQCMIQFFLSQQDYYYYYYYYCMVSQNSNGNVHRRPPQRSDAHGNTANFLASPDHDNNNNNTAVAAACILHLLVASSQDHVHHRTPLDVARHYHHDHIVQYLQSTINHHFL